ncbi:MAG: C40 family peptidase [Lachnospiraceae bacterium]|jgi:SH3-like domain-containing protein|nr:C40 family peptidase [Lachnospiraceae bacterium]
MSMNRTGYCNQSLRKPSKRSMRKRAAALLGLAFCLTIQPLEVLAAEGSTPLLQSAGIGSMMGITLSQEEYLQAAEDAKGALWGYTNIGIADVESGNLNVREKPSTSGKLVGKMPKDSACEVLDIEDEWAYIKSGEVEGYVNLEFLLTGPQARVKAESLAIAVAKVGTDGLRVRVEPNTEAMILTQVPEGEELEFVEALGEWIKISIDGESGYVAAQYVTVEEKLDTAVTMTELLYGPGVSDIRVDIVNYAKEFLGNPYVWGGTSLTKGADCSGFVQSVFKHFGVKLSRTSRTQAKDGRKITASDLKPGDLIFYADSSGTINHVAIYIGGGRVIHASNPKSGIKINKYNYRTPVRYVQILYD